MLVPIEQLTAPQYGSILLIGAPKTWKTGSLGSLHRVLRLRKQPTRIVFFDLDGDGAEPLIRLAREGRELYTDKPGTVEPWINDLEVHRFTKKTRSLGPDDKPGPKRDRTMGEDFINEFNSLDDRFDIKLNTWKPGMEIGCIAFDSLTALQDVMEDFLWLIRGKEIGEKPPASKNEASHMIDPGDWRLLGEKVMDAYQTGKQYPCFLFCTAHEDLREEQVRQTALDKPGINTGKFYKVPLLTKSLAMRIAKDFGTVLYTTSDFQWLTRPSLSEHLQAAGARGMDNLPPIVEQDFAKVLSIR